MRYRLLETLRQYGEDQMELRGETALLRDRHAAHYADLIGELDRLVRGPRQIEGEERMSSEWDNLRAAHLWSLAQGDLDLAERLVEASFQLRHLQHAPRTRRDAAANRGTRRRAAAGRRRPCSECSATGRRCKATKTRARRFAQRGLDVAPSPDHPCHRELLVRRSPASTAAVERGIAGGAGRLSTSGRGGGQHARSRLQLAALLYLIDASLHADPRHHLRCGNS